MNKNKHSPIYKLYETFISIIGEIRRYEYTNNMQKRRPFDINIFINYLSKPDLQKSFVKLGKMSVDGFVTNYIRDNLKEDLRNMIYLEMGY